MDVQRVAVAIVEARLANYLKNYTIVSHMADREDVYWNSFLPAFFDRMSLVMRRNMTDIVSEYGLTSAHAVYLIALHIKDGQTLVSLSRFLDLDTANTNRVIKVLREKKMVYDDRKSESSKKYSIYLTELGHELAAKVMDGVMELNNSYFRDIPREDILQMRNTLIRVLNNMDVDIDSYMGSRYEDPFYTHLHIIPPDDGYEAEPLRLTNKPKKKQEQS